MTASITSTFSDLLANHGALAVFVIMTLDALLPVGGELTMLLAGALAAGAVGNHLSFLGVDIGTGLSAYLTLAIVGTIGYLLGSLIGWEIGRRGGDAFVARFGTWLHLGPSRMAAAERWFDRHGSQAVLLGRLTPLVRSFISIPAGVFGSPFAMYATLTTIGSAIWCFGFAGAGWALGSQFDVVHRIVELGEILLVAAAAVAALTFWRRRRA